MALPILAALAAPLSAGPSDPALASTPSPDVSLEHRGSDRKNEVRSLCVLDGGIQPLGSLRGVLPAGATVVELAPDESGIARITSALTENPGAARCI